MEINWKGVQGNFYGDGNVHYLDRSVSYTGTYMSQNSRPAIVLNINALNLRP
jgi:hypothetical protein